MPYLERTGKPTLHYELDDYTDPWKKASYIVLQHGNAKNAAFWRAWVPYLSRFYKIIRPDLRGMGGSSTDFDLKTGFSVAAYVQDFNDLLDHLGIESAHYCGESSAGTLGLAFAAESPERIRTLTLSSSPVAMPEIDILSSLGSFKTRVEMLQKVGSRGWAEASNAGRRMPVDTDPGMLNWVVDEMGKSHVDVLIGYFRWISTADAAPYLSRIRAPVLGIYPNGGVVTDDGQLALLRSKIGNIRIIRLQTDSHLINVTHAATCALEVLHFISQHDGIICREQ
jgi:3-oxoadipate enol-lactonase